MTVYALRHAHIQGLEGYNDTLHLQAAHLGKEETKQLSKIVLKYWGKDIYGYDKA